MSDFHNTGWDPHQELIKCVHNVGQLALATQSNSKNVKELINNSQQQQQVIEQLMFQNRKLNETLTNQRITLELIKGQVEELKQKVQ